MTFLNAAFNVNAWPRFFVRVVRDTRARDESGRVTAFLKVHAILLAIALLLALASVVFGIVLLLGRPSAQSGATSRLALMGRVIYDAATTLNGFIADDSSSLDWLFAVEGSEQPEAGLFPAEATVLVEGSATYEWVLTHEDLLANPTRWAQLYGSKPTFVFTSREIAMVTSTTCAMRDLPWLHKLERPPEN